MCVCVSVCVLMNSDKLFLNQWLLALLRMVQARDKWLYFRRPDRRFRRKT